MEMVSSLLNFHRYYSYEVTLYLVVVRNLGRDVNLQSYIQKYPQLISLWEEPQTMESKILVFLALLMIFCTFCEIAESSIHVYRKGRFSPIGNSFLFHGGSEGLYGSNDSLKAFIKFESITFKRPSKSAAMHQEMEASTGLIEALIFEIKDRGKIGGSVSAGSPVLCCTAELAKVDGCNQGEVIVHKSENHGWPQRRQINFKGSDETVTMPPETVFINKTGMYNLYFMFCDPHLKGTVMKGKTVWKNPTGYLPGRMIPYMQFYGFMSIAYLILGLIWFSQYVRFWKYILPLQNFITIVIALGMCQMAMWYFEYANFNSTGLRPVTITVWAVTIGAIKNTISRLFLLVVSMGHGVLLPVLSGLTLKVLSLGAVYFIAAESLDLFESVGNVDDLSSRTKVMFMLSVAVLDACFVLWIFFSLSKTLEKLQNRRSFGKLELYRKLTNSLAIAIVLSVAWLGYELYFKATDHLSERWQHAWIITAFWTLLVFGLLCIVCVLWAPSYNASRYAFTEESLEESDRDETVALTTGIVKPTLDVPMKIDRKDRKSSNPDIYSIMEAVEEGKRL